MRLKKKGRRFDLAFGVWYGMEFVRIKNYGLRGTDGRIGLDWKNNRLQVGHVILAPESCHGPWVQAVVVGSNIVCSIGSGIRGHLICRQGRLGKSKSGGRNKSQGPGLEDLSPLLRSKECQRGPKGNHPISMDIHGQGGRQA